MVLYATKIRYKNAAFRALSPPAALPACALPVAGYLPSNWYNFIGMASPVYFGS